MAQYTTIFVLIGGVFGGLAIVILLILFCKYCTKKPPQTGLEEEEVDAEKHQPAVVALIGNNRGINQLQNGAVKERGLKRQSHFRPEIEQNLLYHNEEMHYKDGDPMEIIENKSWRGSESIEQTELCVRAWYDCHEKPDCDWPKQVVSSIYGSRKTPQSSMYSMCGDNKLEVTAAELLSGERTNGDQKIRGSIHDDPRTTSFEERRKNLSALRPMINRQWNSSYPEFNEPHEIVERKHKSHDESSQRVLKRQDEISATSVRYKVTPPIPSKRTDKHFLVKKNNSHSILINESQRLIQSKRKSLPSEGNHYEEFSPTSGDLWRLRNTFEEQTATGQTEENIEEDYIESNPKDFNVTIYIKGTNSRSTNGADFREASCKSAGINGFLQDLGHKPTDHIPDGRKGNFHQIFLNRRGTNNSMLNESKTIEKNFDSIDTTTTEGSSRDDRAASAEFSTGTDFTDSSNECNTKKASFKNFKDDSGYKSLETQVSQRTSSIRVTFNKSEDDSATTHGNLLEPTTNFTRTCSRKRRDFKSTRAGLNNPNIITSFSSFELETTDSNTGDSFDETNRTAHSASSKCIALFQLFHTESKFAHQGDAIPRDYSVDKKSDALFKEFTRYDPQYDALRSEFHRTNSNHKGAMSMKSIEPDWNNPIEEIDESAVLHTALPTRVIKSRISA